MTNKNILQVPSDRTPQLILTFPPEIVEKFQTCSDLMNAVAAALASHRIDCRVSRLADATEASLMYTKR